jgi:hypothetical protein
MARKAVKKEKITEILDRFLGETDPMVPIVGILGATATLGGVTPPFTRLLGVFTQGSGTGGIGMDYTNIIALLGGMQGIATWAPFNIAKMLFGGGGDGEPQPTAAIWGLAASGALEAMLMWRVMGNPEILTTIIKAPAEMVKAVGEIVPG